MRELAGRVAIVTGAAQGIGRCLAETLHSAGASVVLADINSVSMARVASKLNRRVLPYLVDITDEVAVECLIQKTIERFGALDILVNSAALTGNTGLKVLPILDLPISRWRRVIDVNLTGTFICSQLAARAMSQRGGVIVNIASIQGVYATRGAADYGASKAGVIMLTRALAAELGTHGIRVNAVAPGPIDGRYDATLATVARTNSTLLGRAGLACEVANTVLFLVSDRAAFIDGEVLMVDGGAGVRFREPPILTPSDEVASSPRVRRSKDDA